MGLFSFIKKVFTGEEEGDADLNAARARHGIVLSEKDKAEMDLPVSGEERFMEEYDVWEELKHFRSQFFMGSWVTRKFHPIGEEKVKKELEDLERRRREEAEKREQKSRKNWDKWEKWK